MKQLAFLFFFVWTSSWSQSVIKQNYSDEIDFGLACVETSSGLLFNTMVYRSFDWINDIPFNAETYVQTAYFAIEAITENIEITITLYASIGDFPNGTLEVRGTTTYNATPADAFSLIEVPIEAEFAPWDADSIVYELSVLGNGSVSFGYGANSQDQSAPSYLKAENCGINEPTDLVMLGFSFSDSIIMYIDAYGTFIGYEDETINTFRIYPNPVQNELTFSGEHQIENIKVYDLSGRLLIDNDTYSNYFNIDTSKLSAGEYIVTVFSEGKRQHSKFLKM